ncbi:hypothetical protein HAX54_015788 [Datura stramonium]|uniref:Uncharacterized protein n=1 Tax=Datura stramonium TaxID=4076 RepID=A0ABS8UJZ4_DATST|nr:hypothetical protein [Datura stramonium]
MAHSRTARQQLAHTARREAPSSWYYWPRDAAAAKPQWQARHDLPSVRCSERGAGLPSAMSNNGAWPGARRPASPHDDWHDTALLLRVGRCNTTQHLRYGMCDATLDVAEA